MANINKYSVFNNFASNKFKKVDLSRTKPAANHYELPVEVLEIKHTGDAVFSSTASDKQVAIGNGENDAEVKVRIVAKLGSFKKDPLAVVEDDQRVRKFKIRKAKNMTEENLKKIAEVNRFEYADEMSFAEGGTIELSISSKVIDKIRPLESGDFCVIHGINFSYWYSAEAKKVLTFCNVDDLYTVPAARRDAFAQDITVATSVPDPLIELEGSSSNSSAIVPETAGKSENPEDKYKRRLGHAVYHLNRLHPDDEPEYLKKHGGIMVSLDFNVKTEESEAGKVKMISGFRPDFFSGTKAAPSTTTQNGFVTIATGVQWVGMTFQEAADRDELRTLVTWPKASTSQIEIARITSDKTWTDLAPVLLSQSSLTFLVKENLEKSYEEMQSMHAGSTDEGDDTVDTRLVSSVRGVQVNMIKTIRRAGIEIEARNVLDFLDAPRNTKDDFQLQSGLHDRNHHKLPNRNFVINLGEYYGNLSELIRSERYNFYIVSAADLDEDQWATLNDLPKDKRGIVFGRRFIQATKKGMGKPEVRTAIAKEFGITGDQTIQLGMLTAKTEKTSTVFAVYKQEVVNEEMLDSDTFHKIVAGFVPDADAFITKLKHGVSVGAAPAAAAPAVAAAPPAVVATPPPGHDSLHATREKPAAEMKDDEKGVGQKRPRSEDTGVDGASVPGEPPAKKTRTETDKKDKKKEKKDKKSSKKDKKKEKKNESNSDDSDPMEPDFDE